MHIAYEIENEFPELYGPTSVVIEERPNGNIPDGAIEVDLAKLPDAADRWRWAIKGKKVVIDKGRRRTKQAAQAKAKEENMSRLYEGIDLIMNWLSTEGEFTVPDELKSFAAAWQGRKPKK